MEVAVIEHDGEKRECYSCCGSGKRNKRVKESGKWRRIEVTCNACEGVGFIRRTKHRSEDGTWRKKRVAKSYPSFEAPPPFPLGDMGDVNLMEKENEELSFLVGQWKIFQRMDRHRYSTDDLVTSWIAAQEMKQLGYIDPLVLDIGCELGSVLLSTAWQLPHSINIGIEAQMDRYTQALRSVAFNLGTDQSRVSVLHGDLRTFDSDILRNRAPNGFDLITGTPPYFGADQGVLPTCTESSGCLFEMKGGVEVYCHFASKLLRRPKISDINSAGNIDIQGAHVNSVNNNDTSPTMSISYNSSRENTPSIFVMCNTSLASSRVYLGCWENNLSITKRVDVIPREGKPPLFTVFVIVANEWLQRPSSLLPSWFPQLDPQPPMFQDTTKAKTVGVRIDPGVSLRGEISEVITVRDLAHCHTPQYQRVLSDLGKPSSANKEIYDTGSNCNTSTMSNKSKEDS